MKWLLTLFVVLTLGLIFIPSLVSLRADEITDKINELSQKVKSLQGQENSLSQQIKIIDSNTAITTLKINNTKAAVVRLTTEIDELATEIDRLETQLTRRSELVLKRVPETYKQQVAPQFGFFLFSKDFSDFVRHIKYITLVQKDDAQLLFQLKATQQNFAARKSLREDKKIQQVKLKAQLEKEQAELDQQKKSKQALLEQTKNSEAIYQTLLAQALAEKQAVDRAVAEGVKIGHVNKGEPIALVGNTGYPSCSTGAHLHFEVHRNGSWTDPGGFLSGKTVIDQQNGGSWTTGSGSWNWPLEDPIKLTQHYGKTPYSWRYAYSGGNHTGYDMVSNSSVVIRAPADGDLFSSSQNCGSSIIKIKYIDHGGGIMSFFLHVQ